MSWKIDRTTLYDIRLGHYIHYVLCKKASQFAIPHNFIPLLLFLSTSYPKMTYVFFDRLDSCRHNHLSINLSCLTVLMIKQHTTTLLFTLNFVTLLLFLIVKDMYINLIYNTLTCYIEIRA